MHNTQQMGGSSVVDSVTIMTRKEFMVILYCCCSLVLTRPQYQDHLKNFWNNVQPGDLLRSLDQLTSSTNILTDPLPTEENISRDLQNQQTFENALQRRVDEHGSEEILDNKEPYDYDKAYEEFVKQYFDDSVTDALSASVSKESEENEKYEVEPYSDEEIDTSEEINEPIIEASTQTKSKEKCKKVRKGKEQCLICKNPRNGMTSESCSYNKQIKPQNFAFKKQKNFRKYRVKPKESEDDAAAAQTTVLVKQLKLQPSNETNTCTIKIIKDTTCYYCENKNGESITKCYAKEIPENNSPNKPAQGKKKTAIQKSRQRIYKRTISYSYENTPHAQTTNSKGTELLDKPLAQKQLLHENER